MSALVRHTGKKGSHPKATPFTLTLCISDSPCICSDLLKSLPRTGCNMGPGWQQLHNFFAGCDLGREGSQGVGMVILQGGESLTQKTWHLW